MERDKNPYMSWNMPYTEGLGCLEGHRLGVIETAWNGSIFGSELDSLILKMFRWISAKPLSFY